MTGMRDRKALQRPVGECRWCDGFCYGDRQRHLDYAALLYHAHIARQIGQHEIVRAAAAA